MIMGLMVAECAKAQCVLGPLDEIDTASRDKMIIRPIRIKKYF
jgi:hypothetical protein